MATYGFTLPQILKTGEFTTFERADCGDWGTQTAPILCIGDALSLDTLSTARGLIPGDDACGSWAGSAYRWPLHGVGPIRSVACNVEITGRTAQFRTADGTSWVKVRVTWVGHCEPDTYAKGWLRV